MGALPPDVRMVVRQEDVLTHPFSNPGASLSNPGPARLYNTKKFGGPNILQKPRRNAQNLT
jgi:hypothetical protein